MIKFIKKILFYCLKPKNIEYLLKTQIVDYNLRQSIVKR